MSSKRTGPTVRGTKKDGCPRVFVGRKEKLKTGWSFEQKLLTIVGPAHVSVLTASGQQLYSFDDLSPSAHRALAVGLDYYDAANEDAHGRLPHDAGFGSPLMLVPDPKPLPAPVRRLRKAA